MEVNSGVALSKDRKFCRAVSVNKLIFQSTLFGWDDDSVYTQGCSRPTRQIKCAITNLAPFGSQFPPPEALKIYWNCSPYPTERFASLWSLSSLRHLHLVVRGEQFLDFLRNVEMTQVTQLLTLELHLTAWGHQSTICDWIRNLLFELKELSMLSFTSVGYLAICPIETISLRGGTLRHLALHAPNVHISDDCSISLKKLRQLRTRCPNLESLMIDLPQFGFDSLCHIKTAKGFFEQKKLSKSSLDSTP